MKKSTYLVSSLFILFLLSACSQKPPHHPKNPNYAVKKPKIKYRPNKKNLGKMVKKLNGSPYVRAEEGPYNFDCSGYTYYMYGSMGIEIPRVAREQAKTGKYIPYKDLKYGDLLFFDTTKRQTGKITHVGMYLGNGWFTHASTTKHEVVYSNFKKGDYYRKRLRVCRRYLPEKETTVKLAKAKPWKVAKPANIPVVPISAKVTKADRDATGTYYVQVGSFAGRPNKAFLTKVTRNGYLYTMIKFPIDGREISKLLIGPYKTRSKALLVLPSVKQKIVKDAFIAEII